MGAAIAPYARAAYAAGWALSGGPMTARVQAGCTAAVQAACQHADDPHILEVTVDLGRLEGMWALLFHRRDAQQRKHTTAVTRAWTGLFDDDTVDAVTGQVRRSLGIAEADSGDPDSGTDVEALAAIAAAALLQALGDYNRWDALRHALQDALRAGRAEGVVNAVAIAAERAGQRGLDWGRAFQDTCDSLTDLDDTWADTSPWLAALIGRTATGIARALGKLLTGGATHATVAASIAALLTADSSNDTAFVVDWAMTAAADDGALTLYRTQGVLQLDVITVGDGRVCARCDHAESGGPWPVLAAPTLPIHPNCRCCYAAHIDLAAFAAWFL